MFINSEKQERLKKIWSLLDNGFEISNKDGLFLYELLKDSDKETEQHEAMMEFTETDCQDGIYEALSEAISEGEVEDPELRWQEFWNRIEGVTEEADTDVYEQETVKNSYRKRILDNKIILADVERNIRVIEETLEYYRGLASTLRLERSMLEKSITFLEDSCVQ